MQLSAIAAYEILIIFLTRCTIDCGILLCPCAMISTMKTNSNSFNCSIWLSRCKILYYTIFSWLYGLVGSCAHLVMVNSSWTKSHIVNIWKIPERTKRVYPPCDTSALQACLESSHQCCYIFHTIPNHSIIL